MKARVHDFRWPHIRFHRSQTSPVSGNSATAACPSIESGMPYLCRSADAMVFDATIFGRSFRSNRANIVKLYTC